MDGPPPLLTVTRTIADLSVRQFQSDVTHLFAATTQRELCDAGLELAARITCGTILALLAVGFLLFHLDVSLGR